LVATSVGPRGKGTGQADGKGEKKKLERIEHGYPICLPLT